MKKLFFCVMVFLFTVFSIVPPSFADTWYFKTGSDNNWSTLTNWWSNADGTGSNPDNIPWAWGNYASYDLAYATGETGFANNSNSLGAGSTITGACDVNVVDVIYNGEIYGGTFNGTITNNWWIWGGTFNSEVIGADVGGVAVTETLNGVGSFTDQTFEIRSGGTVSGSLTINGGLYNDGTITGGTFNGAVTGTGVVNVTNGSTVSGTGSFADTLSSFTIESGGTVSGSLTINEAVTNNGTITGSTFNGTVTNSGFVSGGTFNGLVSSYGLISGGIFNGAVENNSDANIFNGTFNAAVTGMGSVEVTNGSTVNGTGSFSGDGSFTINSGGTVSGSLTINKAVTNNGTISSGTFNGAVTGTGSVDVTDGSTVSGTGSFADTLNSFTIESGGTVSGSLTIASDVTNNGTISGGTFTGDVTFGSSAQGTGGTISGNTIFNTSSDVDIATVMDGADKTLTMNGTGTVTLSGTNTYTGATTINTGTLKLGNAGVIADSSATIVDGILDMNGHDETVGSLAGSGTVTNSAAGDVTLTAGDDNTSTTFSGVIEDGAGGGVTSFTKTGTGTLTLSGANTYTGDTTVTGGGLTVTGGTFFNGGTVNTTRGDDNDGGSLSISVSDDIDFGANTITSSGGTSTGTEGYNAGAVTLTSSTGAVSSGAIIANGSDAPNVFVGHAGAGGTVNVSCGTTMTLASITARGGIDSTAWDNYGGNGGTVTLSGGTADSIGAIDTTGGSGYFGSGNGGTVSISVISADITSITTSGGEHTGPFDDGGAGGNVSLSGNISVAGNITTSGGNSVQDGSSGGNVTVESGLITVSGNINTSGGTGSSGSDGTAGKLVLNGGTLNFSSLTGGGDVNFDGGTLQYGTGNTQDISAQIKDSTGTIKVDTNGNDVDFSAVIDNSNTGGLTKSGTGTLTFTGTNTYTGGTVIKEGTISLSFNTSQLGTGTVTLGDSAGGSNAATLEVINDGITFSNAIVLASGTTGALTITTFDNLGASSFTGGVTGNNDLVLNAQGNGSTGGITFTTAAINNSGKVTNSGTGDGVALIRGGIGSNVTEIIQNSTTSALTIETTSLTVNASGTTLRNASGGQALTVSGGVAGTGDLVLNNDSTLNAGVTLAAVNNTGLVTNSGTGTGTSTITGVIGTNVTGVVQNSATSNLILSGANLYTGATTINAGTLELSGGSAIADTGAVSLADVSGATLKLNTDEAIGTLSGGGTSGGNVDLQSNTLTVNEASDTTYAGILSGTNGGLTKAGTGTLTLTGANTYTGATAINAGTVRVNHASALGTGSSAHVTNAGTLELGTMSLEVGGNYNQTGVLSLSANSVSEFGSITASGTGSSSVSGTINLTVGGYIPNGGTLSVVNTSGTGLTYGATTINVLGDTKYTFTGVSVDGKLILTASRAANGFAADAGGGNSANAGQVLDNIPGASGDMLVVLNTLDGMSGSEVSSALGTLIPDVSSGAAQGSRILAGQGLTSISNRLGGVRGGGTGGASGISSGDVTEGVGVWMQALGNNSRQRERKGIEGFSANAFGTTIGVDKVMGRHVRVGLAGGYGFANVNGESSGSPTDTINSYSGMIYGSYDSLDLKAARAEGKKSYEAVRNQGGSFWYVDGMVGFTQNNYDSRREIWLGSGKRVAKAEHSGQQYSTKFEGGHTFTFLKTKSLEVTPFATLGYNYLNMNKYKEKGADALNLTVNGEGYHQLEQGLGLKLSYPVVFEKLGTFIPLVKAAWLYDYLADRFQTTARFAGGGASFDTIGAKPARNGLLFGAEIAFLSKGNVTVTGNWDLEARDQFRSNTYYGTIRYDF